MSELDKTTENINKKSNLTISYKSSNSDTNSNTTSISNLRYFPNSKLKIMTISLTIFNILAILLSIIFSFFEKNKNYILNMCYIQKNQIDKTENKIDFFSVFTINKNMLYALLFGLLIFEFAKLIFFISRKKLKIFSRYIYIEMGYWFFVIKLLNGINFLSKTFLHFINFYLNFVLSILLNVLTIGKLIYLYK